MRRSRTVAIVMAVAICAAAAAEVACAEGAARKTAPAAKAAAPARKGVVEPKAAGILKAMSARLAAARSMTFRALATYESPSVYGPPLAYTTISTVTLQRPDKLKVVTTADGPPSEFYYDGKKMTAYAPKEKLAATADAPGSLDAMLKAVYDAAGTYFPFTDVIVSDPWADLSKTLTLAFYIGQSTVVGGVTTDMVAYESDGVFVQMWIGADDKLPRRARAIYYDDRLSLRHDVEISDWKLDKKVDSDDFEADLDDDVAPVAFIHPKVRQAPAPAAAKTKAAAKPAAGAK